jgi:hypothetical protein
MRIFTKARLALAMLVLAIVPMMNVMPASARDSGWVLSNSVNGSSSYGACQVYLRVWDGPFGYAIHQLHSWTNCDLLNDTVTVYATGPFYPPVQWTDYIGYHWVPSTLTYDYVGPGYACGTTTFQVRSSFIPITC